jgi:hypothetical protein
LAELDNWERAAGDFLHLYNLVDSQALGEELFAVALSEWEGICEQVQALATERTEAFPALVEAITAISSDAGKVAAALGRCEDDKEDN